MSPLSTPPAIPPAPAKRLLLVRHAKAVPHGGACNDFDRPLAEKGKDDAATISAILAEAGLEVDLFISSPAKRAFSTAKAFADALGAQSIGIDGQIYEGLPEAMLKIVRSSPDKFKSLMLVGHNPGVTELAVELCPEIDYELPTCAVACIDFDALSWESLKSSSGKLAFLVSSKSL